MTMSSDKKILGEFIETFKKQDGYEDFLKDHKKRGISEEFTNKLLRMWAKDFLISERARGLYGEAIGKEGVMRDLKFRKRMMTNGKDLLWNKAFDKIIASKSQSADVVRKEQKMSKTRAEGRTSRMRTLR